MPILNKENSEDVDRYINFVKTYEDSSLLQSVMWENIREDIKNEAVYLEKKGEIIAAMTIYIKYIKNIKANIMYVPKGPLCALENVELVKMLIAEAKPLIKKYKVFALKFDSEMVINQRIKDIYVKEGFNILEEKTKIQSRYNFKINIRQKNELDLLKKFSDETRSKIKISQTEDLRIRCGNTYGELQEFYALYKKMEKENKKIYREYEYFKRILDTFKENIKIYIITRDEEVVGAAITGIYGKKIALLYDAIPEEYKKYQTEYYMYNNIIKAGLENKCKYCDLSGMYNIKENSEIFKIKKGFNINDTLEKNLGEVDKIFNIFKYNKYMSKV